MTEGAQRPELPAPEDLRGTGAFAGYSEYIMLMEQCWDQDPAARPTFAQVYPPSTSPPFLLNLLPQLPQLFGGHFPFILFSSVFTGLLFYFQVSYVTALLLAPQYVIG